MHPLLPKPAGSPTRLVITREPWSDFFVINLPNGHSEELEVEETREWLKKHGADMDKMEVVLDHVWNFGHAAVTVQNFRAPAELLPPHAPKL